MNQIKSILIYILAFVLISAGCTRFHPDTNPVLDKKALDLANQARMLNDHIISSKGTGWIILDTKTKKERYKIAWAAVFPDKIRVSFLLSGIPVETIIADGKKINFISHTGKYSRHSYYSRNPDMEKFIQIPVKLHEIILILLGRLPLKKFDRAYFSPSDPSLSTVILRSNFRGSVQSLHINTRKKIDNLTTTDLLGNPLYEVMIIKHKNHDPASIPVKIKIKDNDDRSLTLEIINFQVNPPLKDSVFQLTEPG